MSQQSGQTEPFEPPRSLADIDADLKQVTDRILKMIEGLAA
jgi:type I restriction enzyme M protein